MRRFPLNPQCVFATKSGARCRNRIAVGLGGLGCAVHAHMDNVRKRNGDVPLEPYIPDSVPKEWKETQS